ncbi:hypothetical protein OAX11_03600 [Flavobacteriaceae bacterium]|nr:hypothetical protein [Flavobacteriaceae bacterium]
MSLLKNYNLKASSLIESVMAIAIISICISIATLIYVKLFDSDYELAYYKGKQKIASFHLSTIEKQIFENEVYVFEAYTISKIVSSYSPRVNKVDFELKTKNKKENKSDVEIISSSPRYF